MKKDKIATKLFLLISISLAALLGLQMVFQSLYLDKYYLYTKKERITKQLLHLSEELSRLELDEINSKLLRFSQEMGSATGVMDLYGRPLYGLNTQRSFLEMKTEENKIYKVYLESFLNDEEEVPTLREGVQIKATGIEGIVGDTTEFYPREMEIKEGDKTYIMSAITPILGVTQTTPSVQVSLDKKGNGTIPAQVSLESAATEISPTQIYAEEAKVSKTISGTVESIYIPGESTYGNAYREGNLIQETNSFIVERLANNKKLVAYEPIIYEKLDTYVGVNNIIGVIPMFLGESPALLVSMISLQGIEESTEIMNQYVLISFIIVLVIALIGAYLYAQKLTKPLVELRNVTTAIANLDFSKSCSIESQDEIGELASNINQMSLKLKGSLDAMQKDIELKQQLEQQRKQLIADVSHELKTPLTVMKGMCCGLIDGIYNGDDVKNFESMLGQINQMSDLVQELLEVSRLEAEIVLEEEVFMLSDVVFKVHKSLKSLVKEKQLQVSLELEEYFVLGDRKKIERVVRNLYNNAIFYTPSEGEIVITIERKGAEVCFKIVNRGVSIPEALKDKIWEPFYRIDQSRNKKLGGSGLGLYMVKCILEKHHSQYGMTSDSDGVTFWFGLEGIEEGEGIF